MKNILKKILNRETILYVVFGVCTTAINTAVFWLTFNVFNWNLYITIILAWMLSIIFAFITNKLIVFQNKKNSPKDIAYQSITFVGARLSTLAVDLLLTSLMINLLQFDSIVAKTISNLVIIVLNYLLGKFFVFKKKSTPEDNLNA